MHIHLLYGCTGADWKTTVLSEEAKALLVDDNDMEKATFEGKWISFAGLGEAWGCSLVLLSVLLVLVVTRFRSVYRFFRPNYVRMLNCWSL